VSEVVVREHALDAPADATSRVPGTDEHATVTVLVGRADGVKCQRCWRYVPQVSEAPGSEGLCERCVSALELAAPGPLPDGIVIG
jgi:isoleucyl-tRNA synthetase